MSTIVRRIQRDIDHEDFIKRLTSGDRPLFREIWRVLLLAAAIGVKQGVRKPLEKVDTGKSMPESYFNAPAWKGFLYLIGVSDTGDSKCLRLTKEEQENLITAFEEYANQGLHVLRERMDTSGSPLDDLASFMLESCKPPVADADLDDLI